MFQFLLVKKLAIILILLKIQNHYYLQNKSYRDKTEKSSITHATLRRNLNCFETSNNKKLAPTHAGILNVNIQINTINKIENQEVKTINTVMFLLITLTFK